MKHFIPYFVLGLAGLAVPCWGQGRVNFNLGGGPSLPVYNTGVRHDTGWNAAAGLTVNFDSHFGLRTEFQFNHLGVTGNTLDNLDVPDGETRIWSLTLNPVIRFNPDGPVDFYLVGGGGLYHRQLELTTPSVSTFLGYDPFFNYYYTVGVPTNTVVFSRGVYKGGLNGGAGISIPFGDNNRYAFYAEARYHQMYTDPIVTSYLPVTIGFRF